MVKIKFTDLISKPVICINDSAMLGTVENALFDNKFKLKYLCVFEYDKADKLYIPVCNILHAQNSAVIVKGGIYEGSLRQNSPIKAAVYMYDGSSLGICEEIILRKNYYIDEIICSGGISLKPENIVSFSSCAVVVCFDGQKTKRLRRTPLKKKDNTAKSHGADDDLSVFPRDIVSGFNYLIGRKSTASIYDNSKILVKKNAVITAGVIDACRKCGKIILLAKNNKIISN